jgi:rod shape-determining protein MreC
MRRTFGLLIVLTLGHVLLISAQVQSKHGMPLLEAAAFGTFATAQRGTAAVADTFRSVWSHYLGLRGVARENDELRKRVLVLEGQVQEQQAQLVEIEALRDALALQRTVALPTLAARVIAGSPVPGTLNVTIDRGASDGVEPDMAVIAGQGIVGRVIKTAPRAATVQLIVGRNAGVGVLLERPGAGVGVMLERSNVGGVAIGGQGDPPLNVEYVPNTADVQVGDRVLTSGQDGIYHAGFVVGRIEQIEKGGETYRTVKVRPAVDFSHIEFVLVVLARPPAAAAAAAAPVKGLK